MTPNHFPMQVYARKSMYMKDLGNFGYIGIFLVIKDQLISKCPFGVFKSSKKQCSFFNP